MLASVNHIANCRSLERSLRISAACCCTSRQSATLWSRFAHLPDSSASSARRASLIRSHSGVQRRSNPAGCWGEIGSRRSSTSSGAVGIVVIEQAVLGVLNYAAAPLVRLHFAATLPLAAPFSSCLV